MKLKKIIVIFMVCFTCVSASGGGGCTAAAAAALYDPEADQALLNKDQKRELVRAQEKIESYGVTALLNLRDSVKFSLKTHDVEYSEKQKAYKRLLLWYMEERLKILGAI
jgi:hypothetical protein